MTVVIYTKPDCPYCDAAKRDLEDRGDAYVEINIAETPEAEEQIASLSGGPVVVPVVVDGSEVRFGFGGT